jgi:hypothetical protein
MKSYYLDQFNKATVYIFGKWQNQFIMKMNDRILFKDKIFSINPFIVISN